MQHAKISPSGYKRWSNCPGSYTLQTKLGDLLPEDTGSDAATLGTELHDNAEQALKTGSEPREELLNTNRIGQKECSENVPRGVLKRHSDARSGVDTENSIPLGYKNRSTSLTILTRYHACSFNVKDSHRSACLSPGLRGKRILANPMM